MRCIPRLSRASSLRAHGLRGSGHAFNLRRRRLPWRENSRYEHELSAHQRRTALSSSKPVGAVPPDALTLLCHKPPTTTIDCNDTLLSGQLRGATPDSDVFSLWDPVGVPASTPTLTPSAAEVAACRDYSTKSKDVADLLLTSHVGLQSSPYSTEGMQLRLSLLRALQLRPAVEARCKPTAGAALSLLMQGQCSTLGQYLDDLRFAHLLGQAVVRQRAGTLLDASARSCARSTRSRPSRPSRTTRPTGATKSRR